MPALLCAVLAACTDDDNQRRFANDPQATEDAASTASATASGGVQVTPTPTVASASPVPVAQLLAATGGVNSVVLHVGNDLVAAAPPWTEPHAIWSGSDDTLLAFDTTPAGDKVAVLFSPGKTPDRVDLVLLDANGTVDRLVKNLGSLTGATPAPETPRGKYSLEWSPDGGQVLVGLATGGVLAVPGDGKPQLLIGPSRASAPGEVAWSPRGDAIAFVSPSASKISGGLYVAPTGAVPLDPVPVVPPSAGGRSTISRFQWSPNSATLYYTVVSTTGDPTFGGDLFAVPAAGGNAKLIATASRVSPVSAITNFAISPDGAGVAFVVTVPGDNGQPIDSLWLQAIGSPQTTRLPVGSGELVTGIWWTTDGLIWSAAPADEPEKLILYRAKSGEAPGIVYGGPAVAATPAASPEASPVALPDASPVASPLASPEVSASPIAE